MSTPAPGPRVVEVHEVVASWPAEFRESFAWWVGHMAPELVDEYDALIRRLEKGIVARTVKSGLTPS